MFCRPLSFEICILRNGQPGRDYEDIICVAETDLIRHMKIISHSRGKVCQLLTISLFFHVPITLTNTLGKL